MSLINVGEVLQSAVGLHGSARRISDLQSDFSSGTLAVQHDREHYRYAQEQTRFPIEVLFRQVHIYTFLWDPFCSGYFQDCLGLWFRGVFSRETPSVTEVGAANGEEGCAFSFAPFPSY